MKLNIEVLFSIGFFLLVANVFVSSITYELSQKRQQIKNIRSLWSKKHRRVIFYYNKESSCGESWASSNYQERKLVVLG